MAFVLQPEKLVVMFMTTETDKERVQEQPPQLPFEVEPWAQATVIDNARRSAYRYDAYKTIVQLSFLSMEGFAHFLLCDDPEYAENTIDTEYRHIAIVDTEEKLVQEAATFVRGKQVETDGMVMSWRVFAGWKILADNWPLFVNKAFAYRQQIPYSLVSNPMKRFSTNDHLLEVSNIYSQGMSMGLRPLPTLPDALRYWGYGIDGVLRSHPTPQTICKKICEDPLGAAKDVECYLRDMTDVIARYYGWRNEYDELAKLMMEVRDGRSDKSGTVVVSGGCDEAPDGGKSSQEAGQHVA